MLLFSSAKVVAYDKSWISITGNITIEDVLTDVPEGSIIDSMIKSSGKSKKYFLDKKRGIVKVFIIKYEVPIKINQKKQLRIIVQHGLFNSLHKDLKQQFKNFNMFSVPLYYNPNNPIEVVIGLNDKIYTFPVLLTENIDDEWQ